MVAKLAWNSVVSKEKTSVLMKGKLMAALKVTLKVRRKA